MVRHQRATGGVGGAPVWSLGSQRALERLVFPARHVAAVAVAIAIPFVPDLGGGRWALLAFVLLVLLPSDIAFAAWTRRHGRFPPVMPISNQFMAAGIVLAIPGTYAAAAVLLLADDALTALVFGRRFAVRVGGLGAALLATVALIVDPMDGAALMMAFAIGALSVGWIIGSLGERERAAALRYSALVGEIDVIVWEMAPGTSQFSYVSPAAESVLGYPVTDWYEPGFWEAHVHPDDAERAVAEVDAAIAEARDHVIEYRMVAVDGRAVHLRDVASVQADPAGRATLMRGVMMDVSDRRRAEELLRERATHDVLTGLPNRALFADRLDQSMREAKRTGDRVALLLLDLDDFKEVNDALGHDAGDRLLVAFAERLRHEVRDCDTIARLGGDEFALLLTTGVDPDGAVAVAHRVEATTDRPFDIDGLQLRTDASIGIALYPDHADDPQTLSARADVAMYLAKRSGSGSALYEAELDRSSVRRLSLLGHLREAIASDQLELEFQPCFDLRTGCVAAVEALVRWEHPEHGRIHPDDFIRLAEMSGLIEPLTRWVITRAVETVAAHPGPLQVSANLSVRNLGEPDLVGWLAELVDGRGLAAGQLVLELTESEVMSDVVAASATLRQIADLGIGLAIDDFGAGQSALAYLRTLPMHELKIDRSIVHGVGSDPEVAAICAAVVDLAHRLDLRVVAEGASDGADVEELRRMSCDRAQGYYLGNPEPADRLEVLLQRTIPDSLAEQALDSRG